jgi:hypothetical protein
VTLNEMRTRVESAYAGKRFHVSQRYGDTTDGYYILHGSQVGITYYGKHVGELDFMTPYYRTTAGFGVGSRIPLGPCHRAAPNGACVHLWRGFIYNPTLRERPCNCWVKVGTGAQSLPVRASNFLKPWFFIYLHGGRIARMHFALKYVD